MNVYGTDVKHHPIVVKRNAVEVDVNIIDVDVTAIDGDLDSVKVDANITDMLLHIGGVKFPLVDMKRHLELVPLPHCELKNAARADYEF